MLGTALGAVGAGGAGHGAVPADELGGPGGERQLLLAQRAEVGHIPGVVLHLGQGGHAGEHHHHLLQAGGEPDGPGGQGGGGIIAAEEPGHLGGGIGQLAPLHRLHDHHLLAVAHRGLVAQAGLDAGALPVQIVELELDKLHLGVFGEHPVQHLGAVVEGKAQVADAALFLLPQQVGEGVQRQGGLVGLGVDVVQQVVVKIVHPAPLQLGAEDLLLVGGGLVLQGGQGHLVRQGEAVPGMAVHQGLPDYALAGALVIEPGGVKIGEPPLQEQVHHGLYLFQIHRLGVVWIEQGEPHTAKA